MRPLILSVELFMYTSGLIFPNVNAGASSLKLQGTYFIHGLIRKRFVFKKKKGPSSELVFSLIFVMIALFA